MMVSVVVAVAGKIPTAVVHLPQAGIRVLVVAGAAVVNVEPGVIAGKGATPFGAVVVVVVALKMLSGR